MYVDDPLETHIISMIAATENLHRHLQFRVSGSEGVKTGFVPVFRSFTGVEKLSLSIYKGSIMVLYIGLHSEP